MKELLKKLTLKEKLGQLTQLAPHFFNEQLKAKLYGKIKDLEINYEELFYLGSILGIGGPKEKKELQDLYLKNSKSKIPLLFMGDVIHGCKTIYPVPLAQACSFNVELVKENAKMAAREAKAFGLDVTFSPMSDLVRDPRWGRVIESYGEDPHLNYSFSKATAKGYQEEGLISCVKHFAAYGLSEAGRDYNTVDLSRVNLFNYYLSGYQGALEGGSEMVMTAFNTFEYLPATINRYLLTNIIRENWGYDEAVIIADYDALLQTKAHGVTKDDKDAAVKGILAGLDIEMASTAYLRTLEAAIKKDKRIIKAIDEAVLRVLKLKEKANLFNNAFSGDDKLLAELINSKEHQKLSYQLAVESVVLLKNENNILPLNKNIKVALLGNYATSNDLLGAWSWYGDTSQTKALNDFFEVEYLSNGEDYQDYDLEKIKKIEAIILTLGEEAKESGEARSKANINLKYSQVKLIKKLKKLGKPLILILFSGRPLILTEIIKDVDALFNVFFLGSNSSKAIYDLVYGSVNPSGKLAMTFPRSVGQIPLYYNHLRTGRPFLNDDNPYSSHYLDEKNEPLFPFGFGLSYSSFVYEDLKIDKSSFTLDELPTIKISILNESKFAGKEVVMLFIKDEIASISRPVKELKQFKKVSFQAGERKEISFKLKYQDLAFYNQDLNYQVEAGDFLVMVADKSLKITLKGDENEDFK